MNTPDIYSVETGMLTIKTHEMETEFEFATRHAIENNQIDFKFYGYIIVTAVAVDTVQAILAHRTYH
jgi:hypothetical protein